MTKPKILVTGATGNTGQHVVAGLLEKGFPVRAAIRKHDARSDRLKSLGAEVVVADLFDFDQLSGAMRGTQRAYYCPPFHPQMTQSATAFALAAREAKIESIVDLSQWLASPAHPSLMTRQHWLTDRLFETIPDVALTIVTPGYWADAYLTPIAFATQLGIFVMPASGESRNPVPSVADIARVAVGALIDPQKHAGKTYRPTGPVSLSVNEMTEIIGRVVGRRVRHVRPPMWMFYKAARRGGIDERTLSTIRHYIHEIDAGTFAFGGPTGDVFEVTGRQPEDFETIVRRHAALPQARQSFRNTLRALGEFMLTPFLPGLDPIRYERERDFPSLPSARFDLESERWKAEHRPLSRRAQIITRIA